VRGLTTLKYEPITTLHFEFGWVTPSVTVGMLMLDADPGQWLFWQQLPNGHWRASVVISAHHRTQSEAELTVASLTQLRNAQPMPAHLIRFACSRSCRSALVVCCSRVIGAIQTYRRHWRLRSSPASAQRGRSSMIVLAAKA
jgi:hypothetical protein